MSSEAPRLPQAIAATTEDLAWAGTRRLALRIDASIGMLTEAIGAALVLVEIGILFAGVVSRYVFDSPLMWTDELANFLFLWLAMLGAVVAFRRDGHMRLTTFVNSLSPERGRWLGTVGALVVIVFVLEILVPAAQYLQIQQSTDADHRADIRRLPGARHPGRLDPVGDHRPAAPARDHDRLARPGARRRASSARSPAGCGWRSRC